MAIAENHRTRPVKGKTIDIIDDIDNIGPFLPLTITTTVHKFTVRTMNV